MRERDLQNEKLDRIGRSLLKSARVNDEDIEKIIAAPRLFDSVKARIKAEEQSRRKSKPFFGDWTSLPFWNRQGAAGAFAILIVTAICASVIIFKKQDLPQTAEQTVKPDAQQPQIRRAENMPPLPEIKKSTLPATEKYVRAERVAFKPETPKTSNPTRKANPVKSTRDAKKQSQEVFYSLGFAGNWEATGEDLQIVRAELSRSELFALGVDLPVENDAPKIKTDLLVGADGVARAFRFVQKFQD